MFRETVTSADGTTDAGMCDEAHALGLLRTAVRRGYRVEATRTGGAVIVRDVASMTSILPRHHTVTLEPAAPAGKVTATMRLDLAIIGRRMGKSLAAQLNPRAGRIDAGLNSIPPAAAKRLIDRGLVTVAGAAVSVSLAARLAMLAQDHHTSTSEPPGYQSPVTMAYREAMRNGRTLRLTDEGANAIGLNKPGRRAGKRYYRDSTASCACGWSYPAEDRDSARRKAHEHRQQVTATLVGTL